MEVQTSRVRKSEALTDQERADFTKWVDSQPTKIDAAETIGIHRVSLDRIMLAGSGSPENIERIRKVLQTQNKNFENV